MQLQVMYMYYLLAYRLFGEGSDYINDYLNAQAEGNDSTMKKTYRRMPSWLERAKLKQNKRTHVGKSSVFETMEESLVEEVRSI
jgi:hypothetical protein